MFNVHKHERSINIGERRRAVAYRLRNSQWKIRELQICSSARQVGTHQTHLAAHGIKDDSYHDEYCVVIPKHIANSPTEISLQGLYNENKCLEDLEIRACGTYLINDREERQIVILICFTGLKNHLLSSIATSINGEECHYTDIIKLIHCQNWWSSSHSTEQCTNKTSCGNHQSKDCMNLKFNCARCFYYNKLVRNQVSTDHVAKAHCCHTRNETNKHTIQRYISI